MAIVKNIINKKFGRLLVIRQLEERGNRGQIKYECLCDCGNKHIVTGESLRSGKSKSCGCFKKDYIPKNKILDREKALWKQLYNSTIKKRSKKLNYISDIDIDEFIKISKSRCNYCGLEKSNILKDRIGNFYLKYNGIDRINSSKGYMKNNSVACCKYCNIAKNTMTVKEFISFIKRVYEFNNRSGL